MKLKTLKKITHTQKKIQNLTLRMLQKYSKQKFIFCFSFGEVEGGGRSSKLKSTLVNKLIN